MSFTCCNTVNICYLWHCKKINVFINSFILPHCKSAFLKIDFGFPFTISLHSHTKKMKKKEPSISHSKSKKGIYKYTHWQETQHISKQVGGYIRRFKVASSLIPMCEKEETWHQGVTSNTENMVYRALRASVRNLNIILNEQEKMAAQKDR